MKLSLAIPPVLITLAVLLLIYILWTGQFQDEWILGSFFMVVWGIHFIVAFVRGATMWPGAISVHNTEDMRHFRLALLLLGVVFCIYFGIQIIKGSP
ncbi:MAG: hypothetical protein AB1720_11085 [Pseudomonadota bacterium]